MPSPGRAGRRSSRSRASSTGAPTLPDGAADLLLERGGLLLALLHRGLRARGRGPRRSWRCSWRPATTSSSTTCSPDGHPRLGGPAHRGDLGVPSRRWSTAASTSPMRPTAAKLLEYNADTPTALLETAVQWHWMQDLFGRAATSGTPSTRPWSPAGASSTRPTGYPASGSTCCTPPPEGSGEDFMTIGYLAATAHEAGLRVELHADREHRLQRRAGLPRHEGALRRAPRSSSIPGSGWCASSSPARPSSAWAISPGRPPGSSPSGR